MKTLNHLFDRADESLCRKAGLRKVQHFGRFGIARVEYLAQKQRCLFCWIESSTDTGEAKCDVFPYLIPEVRRAQHRG